MNNINELTSLLRIKESLKLDIKRVKQKVKAQEKTIENQKQRAENGKPNTLGFEQKQLPIFILELKNVENELKEIKIKIKTFELENNDLKLRAENTKDKSGFPTNKEGKQVAVFDKDGNVMLLLSSNFLAKFSENSCIKFNPSNKEEVNTALDTLVNVLTQNFNENIKGYFTLDLTDKAKKEKKLRTKEPLKIPRVQMYFDWVDGWLQYLGNIADSIELKLLFYKKYKDRIKKNFISLETNLNKTNVPKNYVSFATKWIEHTDKNFELENQLTQSKEKKEPVKSINSKDDRILIVDLFNYFNNKTPNEILEIHLNNINADKFFIINYNNKKFKIYSPSLAYLFSTKDINGRNMETKEGFKLDTRLYFKTFVDAFINGEKHFKNDYEVSKNVFYGSNISTIISDIHTAYYHTIHNSKFTGWHGVVHSNPTIITHKIIDSYGFYSGVLSKADEFILKYPNAFKDFHKCNDESQESQSIITKEQVFKERNNLIPDVLINNVYDFFKVLIDKPNRKGEFYLSEQKLLIFIKATFIDKKPIKQNFDVAFSKDKIDVRSVFKRFQDYCYDLEYNKTYVKDKYFKIMFESFEGFSQTTDFSKWHKTNNKLPTLKKQKAK